MIGNPEEKKELFQNNALLDLALSLSLPVFSFNSHFFESHCERKCFFYNTVSKLECPRARDGGKMEYKCSEAKKMVILNHRGLSRTQNVTFTL